MELIEGNDGQSFQSDNVHGTHAFQTLFRNFFHGDPARSDNTTIIHLWAYSRYFNMVGNVLGRTGYYDTYETNSGSSKSGIYGFGEPDVGAHVQPDALTRSTSMRWGNFDTVTGGVRFVAAEVPSKLASFSTPVPATQRLPPSLYLAVKPSWLGDVAWPPIGPDVMGGNVPGYAGHANEIAARKCYRSSPRSNGILDFNGQACYGPLNDASAKR
jgi:hypothetical protein